MGQCKFCGRKGFFLSVDSNGLCGNCSPSVVLDITQRTRIMSDSLKLAREGKTFSTRISRCDLLLEHAEHLLEYERKGIPTLTPLPSELIEEFKRYRGELVLEEAMQVAEKAKAKAEVAATATSKQNALGAGLLKVREIMQNNEDVIAIGGIELELKTLMRKAKLDGFLEAAKKAEFKGNKKKAIDQYQEALYFIRNDDVPDDQQNEEIRQIEAKLKDLGAAK